MTIATSIKSRRYSRFTIHHVYNIQHVFIYYYYFYVIIKLLLYLGILHNSMFTDVSFYSYGYQYYKIVHIHSRPIYISLYIAILPRYLFQYIMKRHERYRMWRNIKENIIMRSEPDHIDLMTDCSISTECSQTCCRNSGCRNGVSAGTGWHGLNTYQRASSEIYTSCIVE